MKSMTFFCLLISNYLLYPIKCSNGDIVTLEGLQIVNEPLSFSFNKDNYSDFRCNFNDKVLTHSSLKTPPFYYSIPVYNFFSTFCLIFQYSEIIHDEEFKQVAEKIFKCYLGKIHMLKNNSSDFLYNPRTFEDYLTKLNTKINKILLEDDENVRFVKVEENKDRVTITLNDSSNIYYVKLLEEFSQDFAIMDLDKEIEDAMIVFYIKINEMYLQNQLNTGYLNSLFIVTKKYTMNLIERNTKLLGTAEDYKNSYSEPLKLYSELVRLISKKNNIVLNINEPDNNVLNDNIKEFEKDLKKAFENYTKIFTKKHFNGELPKYLSLLISKVKSIVLLKIIEDTNDLDFFSLIPKECVETLFSLKKILSKSLKDSNKISYSDKMLSDESIMNLVKNCLELVI